MVYAKARTELGGWIWRVCKEAEAAENSAICSKERQDDIPVRQESQQVFDAVIVIWRLE